MRIVYHGGTSIIKQPLCAVGRDHLDLGKGFYLEGGVADDRVVDTIEFYLNGDITEEMALKRLSLHQSNNQICILNQSLIEEFCDL